MSTCNHPPTPFKGGRNAYLTLASYHCLLFGSRTPEQQPVPFARTIRKQPSEQSNIPFTPRSPEARGAFFTSFPKNNPKLHITNPPPNPTKETYSSPFGVPLRKHPAGEFHSPSFARGSWRSETPQQTGSGVELLNSKVSRTSAGGSRRVWRLASSQGTQRETRASRF